MKGGFLTGRSELPPIALLLLGFKSNDSTLVLSKLNIIKGCFAEDTGPLETIVDRHRHLSNCVVTPSH